MLGYYDDFMVYENEDLGCFELLRWNNGWEESGLSFETELDAINYLTENTVAFEEV